MRKPLIAGNWKMNLNHLEAIAVTQKLSYSLEDKDFDAVDVCVIPPFTDIRSVQTLIDGDRLRLQYGAQDLSPEVSGAFTGDISGSMLNKLGCTYVVVGHSERRHIFNENDKDIRNKVAAAIRNGIRPILCIGETAWEPAEPDNDPGDSKDAPPLYLDRTAAARGLRQHPGQLPATHDSDRCGCAHPRLWSMDQCRIHSAWAVRGLLS